MSGERITLRGAPVVMAPGKLFLAGEYSVLHGGPAVVAGVSRHATAQYIPGLQPDSPVVDHAVKHAVKALGEAAGALPLGSVLVDTTQFHDGDRKLGLGSSAATAVVTVGAVFEYCGYPIASHEDEVFEVANRAHRDAQGGVGSGADVAAAVHGGFVHFQRPQPDAPAIRQPLAPVPGLHMVAFFTGQSASTRDMIQAVQTLSQKNPPLHQWLMDELAAAADRFVAAFVGSDVPGVIAAAHTCHEAMRELGLAAQLPVITPLVDQAAQIASSLGGSAKPSGAGGGDMGVAFFANPNAAWQFAAQCPDGISVLDLHPVSQGLHRRRPGIVAIASDDVTQNKPIETLTE